MKCFDIFLTLSCCLMSVVTIAAEPESAVHASVPSNSNAKGTDLRTLLRDVGARLHKHFVVDPRAPELVDSGDLTARDISYAELLSVLEVNHLVVVTVSGVNQVLPDSEVRQSATPLVAPDSIKGLDDEWIATVLPVKNISAAQLVPLLRPLLPQAAHLVAFPERNALVIVDRSANAKRIVELVRTLENLPKPAEVSAQKAP